MKLDIEFEMTAHITHELTPGDLQLIRYELQRDHGADFTKDQVREAINEYIEARYDLIEIANHGVSDFDWKVRGVPSRREDISYLHQALQDTPFIRPEVEGQTNILDAIEHS